MEEELSFNNVMSAEDVMNLFGTPEKDTPSDGEKKDTSQKEDNQDIVEEAVGNPFEEDQDSPESVDNGDHKGGKTEVPDLKNNSGSSSNNFSSIASTLKEFGTFSDLSDEDIKNITDGESLIKAIDKTIKLQLDERQKRIDSALNANVEPSVIKQYENVIDNLENISEETIRDEDEQGETLRKNLIFQDYVNRGYSKERAEKEVQKSFKAGTDIEDALDALESNKQFYTNAYNDLIEKNNEQIEAARKAQKDAAEALRKSILEDDKAFNDLVVDTATRRKIYDSITKPIYKDESTKQ